MNSLSIDVESEWLVPEGTNVMLHIITHNVTHS